MGVRGRGRAGDAPVSSQVLGEGLGLIEQTMQVRQVIVDLFADVKGVLGYLAPSPRVGGWVADGGGEDGGVAAPLDGLR